MTMKRSKAERANLVRSYELAVSEVLDAFDALDPEDKRSLMEITYLDAVRTATVLQTWRKAAATHGRNLHNGNKSNTSE